MKQSYTLLLLFWLIVLNTLYAKDMALYLADKFYQDGNYNLAITEYKRFLYFNPSGKLLHEAEYKIALAYRKQQLWQEAIVTFRKAMSSAANDSVLENIKIEIGITLLASAEYSLAEFEFLQVSYFSIYPDLQKKALFFLGVCHIYNSKWEDAQKIFHRYWEDVATQNTQRLDSLFRMAQTEKSKSPSLAKWLSTFVPGSGQIYGGDWKNGINALILNGFTTYFLGHALAERRFQDAIISYLTPFERYYRGNRYHAERISKAYNEKKNRHWSHIILNELRHRKNNASLLSNH